jgi:hypothetical protein
LSCAPKATRFLFPCSFENCKFSFDVSLHLARSRYGESSHSIHVALPGQPSDALVCFSRDLFPDAVLCSSARYPCRTRLVQLLCSALENLVSSKRASRLLFWPWIALMRNRCADQSEARTACLTRAWQLLIDCWTWPTDRTCTSCRRRRKTKSRCLLHLARSD